MLSDNDWTELEVFLDSVEDLFVSRLNRSIQICLKQIYD